VSWWRKEGRGKPCPPPTGSHWPGRREKRKRGEGLRRKPGRPPQKKRSLIRPGRRGLSEKEKGGCWADDFKMKKGRGRHHVGHQQQEKKKGASPQSVARKGG